MLKTNRFRKWHVPNTLAIAAALLLLVTALADVEQPADPAPGAASLAAGQGHPMVQPADAPEHLAHAPAKQAHKFRVHLFMFRH